MRGRKKKAPRSRGEPSFFSARVLDRAGNQADFPFRVRHAPFVALTITATRAYDYIFEYYGASVQTFSIPYSTAAFFLSDRAGIGGFELKRNGAVVYAASYPASTATVNVSLNLADGEYAFRVDTVRGQSTSGAFTKYTAAVTPVLARPQAAARLEAGVFKVNFPVTCANTGPVGTGLSALTIRRIAVEGVGVNRQHVFKETAASLACGGSYDGHLDNGLYGVVGLDRGYEIVNYFTIDTQPVAMQTDFRDGIFNQVNTVFDGFDLRLSTTGVFVKAVPDPLDTRTVELVAASGSADTRAIDLFKSSDTLIVPYGAIGVALSTPPGNALNFAGNSEYVEETVGDTGLSQAFAVSSDGGAFLPVARWKLFLAPTPACAGVAFCAHDFDYRLDQTQPMTMIGPSIKVRQTLTNNTAIYRGNTPGSVTPIAGFPPLSFLYVMTSTVAIEDMPLDSAAGLPAIAGNPAFQISSPHAGVLVFLADPNDPTLLAKVAELASRGQKWAGGSIALVDPPLLQFNAPAVATMRFDPAAVAARGIAVGDLALYQAEPGGNFYRVANQVLSVSQGFISAPILKLSQASLFGIFGPGTPPSAPVADVLPPRTSLTATGSSVSGATINVSSRSVLGFAAPDDKAAIGDAQGVGAARTYYAADGGGFVVAPGTFSLVAEGTHTLTFFSVDLHGNAELTKTQAVAVDATAPTGVVVSSRALFVISAVDPIVKGAASGVDAIRYLVDFNPSACNGVVPNPAAAAGTCQNPDYAGPFPLTNGPHSVAFRATDKVGNDTQWQFQQVTVVPQSENGGLGIGRDAFDAFWSVLSGRDAFGADVLGFARANSSGVLLASATLQNAASGMPWSVLFDQGGRAYAIGGAAGPSTLALDLAVYKASPDGAAIESRTLFDSGYANNDMAFDAKAPGWIVGAAQTSGPADFAAPGNRAFSLALWRFDPALGTVRLTTTYARAGFDLGAGLAVDADGSLWIVGYSLSPAAPAVGGYDLALWHYAADGQTLLGGPFLRPGYLNDIDGGLTARVFVTNSAVYVAAPRADAAGGTDMAFLRYDKATGQPTSENAWRSADGSPSYPVAILPQASGMLVAGGIGAAFTEAGLWRFGFDGSLRSATTADAGGAKGAVFRGSELWLSVDGSSVPYRVQAEAVAIGSLIDLQPPRTNLSAGVPAFIDGQTVYATSATPFAFTIVDDKVVIGDGLGVGATQTFYAEDGGAYSRFTSSFTLVAEGTHTISFFSIDLKGHAEATRTQTVGVDLTAPVVTLVSSGSIFTIAAVDPVVGGAASGVGRVFYIVDHAPDCPGIVESSAAPHGTCENPSYAGPFELAVGTHTVYYAASDRVLNGDQVVYSSFVAVAPRLASIAVTPSTASIPAGTTAQFAAAGTFTDGSTRTLTGEVVWSTDVSSVAAVGSTGLARGVGEGAARVSASSGAVTGYANLTVTAPVLVSIVVTPSTASILAGETAQFAAAGTFTDGSTRTLTTSEVFWSTDVSSVATVSVSGLATGMGGGAARVIAVSGAISGQAALTVTVPTPTVSSIFPDSAETGASVPAAVVGTGFYAASTLSLERTDALRGTWAATGSFGQGRYFGTLTKLRDGRALLAGGITGATTIGSAAVDLYDPATGVWTAGPPLNQGRNQYAAVMLADGRVLVSGGYGPGVVVNSAEIYDPALNAWTAAAPMASIRSGHQLVLLPDGRVLAAGGMDGANYLNSAEIYNPLTNTWSPAASMVNVHSHPAAAALGDGKVMIAGGFGGNSTTEVYDPATNAWTPAGSMHVARYLPRAALLPNGKILVSGGSGAGTPEPGDVYDPVTNAWTATGLMAVPRYIHVMVLVNGTPFVIDGENSSTGIASTEIYDAATNAWLPGPALTTPRTWTSGVTLGDGRVLVAGGLGSVGGATLNTAEVLGAPSVAIAATGVRVSDARHLMGTLDLTGAALGSWDVVVREPGGRFGRLNAGFRILPRAPTLSSLAVTPEASSILAGETAQFAAAGTFSDGSTRTLTGAVMWKTSVSTVAEVNAAGLATGLAPGIVLVIASSGAISGQAVLTVRARPPTVSSIAPASAASGGSFLAAVVGTSFDASAALSLERSDALRGTWAPTGSFGQGRYFGTLTKLRDGRALLAGGITGLSTIGSAAVDLYDPATGVWTAGPPLIQARNQHAAVVLADGRVLVSGGYGPGAVVNTAEIYNPALNTWTAAAPMASIRSGHKLALLPNGRVLAAGGMDGANFLSSAEIYDPVADAWSTAASMSGGHSHPASATLSDGKVMIVGGFGSTTAEVYNPAANAWASAGSTHFARYLPRAALLPSGKILVTGGSSLGAREAGDVYDPATNAWTATGLMAVPRYIHVMVLVNGTPLVIDGESSSAIASTEVYDAATNAWLPGPPLSTARTWTSGVTLDDGRVLVAGGLASVGGATLNTAEVLGAPSVAIAATGVSVTDAQHLSGTVALTGAATGYWDVVVRESGGRSGRLNGGFEVLPSPLASIAVTPASATILPGTTAQFTAVGTFTDGSTRTLAAGLAWSTDVSSVATIGASGLAIGVAGGTAHVLASSGAVSGQALLNVSFIATSTVTVNGVPEVMLVSTAPFSVVIASTKTGAGAVALGSAAAQGMILVGTVYDMTRQDPGATAILTWYFDPALVDAAAVAIWRFDGISWSSVTVLNQVVTVTNGVGTVRGEVVRTSLFGLFVRDITAPITSLAVLGGRQFPGPDAASFYASADTRFALPAADPVTGGAASGLALTRYQDNGGAFQVFASAFGLPEGAHLLAYQSRDNFSNLEVPRSTTVFIDATAPVSSATTGSPFFVGADGTRYITPATPVTLSAFDPVVNAVASGVDRIEIAIDGGAFGAYASMLTFAEGRHTILFRALDRVGNVSATRRLDLQSDNTPPATAFAPSGALFSAGGLSYAPARFTYALPAQDPVISNAASGVAFTNYRTGQEEYRNFVSAFSLSEGIRRVDFQSQDNVGNLELLKSATVFVDATAPDSALAIGNPKFDPGNGRPVFVAAATPLTLSAQDPVIQEVASGVRRISFQRGSDPFGSYSAPFTLPLPDGLKTVDYFAADNVGNAEVSRSVSVALDDTAPLTSLAVLGGRQFPGPDAASFYASADTRYALPAVDPAVGGVASGLALTRWQENSGAFQSFSAAFGLAEGGHLLAYQSQDRVQNLEVPRSTTVLVDATPPVSSVLIGAPIFTASDGTIYITPTTPLTLSAVDPALPTGQPGSGLSQIEVSIDGGPFSAYSAALTFAEGRHTLLYRAVDNVANVEVVHALLVRSDATAPVSALVVGQPQFQLPSVLLVSTRTPFSIAPVDPIVNNVAAGVKDTSFRVSGTAAFSAFTAPFTLAGADENKVIEFYSRDNVLNTEVVRSSTVLLDSTPPEVALLSPASCGAGICRVLKGKFPVLGTARDPHFGNYQLESAAGQNASTGFTLISSGTLTVSSGTLGTWDATALSGWFTVRLTAVDLVANAAAVTLSVFVGDPGQLMVLGNHEVFNMPEGVAVGGDGKIYVADRNNDRIAVFSSTGALLASLGGRKDEDDDHGKHEGSTTTLRLNKPSGVAVDAAGNVYVADTNRDRVLKLSASGQVLLTLGRREREHDEEHEHTPLSGQFHHPAGVAVDAASNIYVADTGNRRVQVFNSTGAFNFSFNLPPVPARLDHDDDEKGEDDAERAQLGKPFGIAVDAAGNIYVADSKGGRALKFGATGELLLTISIPGDKPGHFGRPFGVAVSAEGDCLLVADRKTSRIFKFDFLGNSNLVFASKGKIADDDAPAPSGTIVLNKPMGLALDAQGSLFVADRNNNRIQKFGLPTGQTPLVVPTPKPEDEHVARGVVDAEDGGKVERRDRAAVDIPAGAVALDLKVTVSTPAFSVVDDSNRRRAAEDAKLKTASPPVEYGPEGTKFKGVVTLTLPYSPELIALQKIDAKDLSVRYWNRGKSKWEDLESEVDPKTRTVKAKTAHFSLYQVFAGTVSAAAPAPLAADATFIFRDAYAFPNPVRGSGPVTIRIQTGQADSVEVRVYDVSGRKIHSSSDFALNTNLDDGNGKGAQYTYDHVWDVSGVGSGVYQYVITAKKAGQSDIHKSGRVGVVK